MGRMRLPRSWLNEVRRKFQLSSPRNIVVFHSNACSHPNEAEASGLTVETEAYELPPHDLVPSQTTKLEREDIMAAIKIQSIFRGHLARKAFRALRSLVKLQALARGAYVRNQSRIAMHCMHALVRLQVRVRARQILSASNDNY